LLSKNIIQQFLRLKIKFNLLIHGNAQEAKRVHVKIKNTLEFTRKLIQKDLFLFPVPYYVLLQRINFNMYAKK